jgi:hypothetical protein
MGFGPSFFMVSAALTFNAVSVNPLCASDSRHPALMSAAAFLIRTFGAHAVPPAKSLLDAVSIFLVGEIMPAFGDKPGFRFWPRLRHARSA